MRVLLNSFINIRQCQLIRYTFKTVTPRLDENRNISFQVFFKEIQKAKDSQHAIDIYQKFQTNSTPSLRYLAITMRILNRFLNFNNNKGLVASSHFVTNKIEAIKALRKQQIPFFDLKDITIFLLDYTSAHYGNIDQSIRDQCLYLSNKYLSMFKQLQTKLKIQNVYSILTSMKSIGYYYSELFEVYLDEAVNVFSNNMKHMIKEGYPLFQFINILQKFIPIVSQDNINKINSIAQYIHEEIQITSFQRSTLIAMLQCYYEITNYHRHSLNCNITDINSLVSKVQRLLLESIQQLNGRTIQQIIPIMLRYNTKAQLLTDFYKIIAKSINNQGQTCFNPLFVITAISYLNHNQYSTLVHPSNPDFFNHFLQFLKRYYGQGNKYESDIYKQLQMIIERQPFSYISHLKLLQYSISFYRNHSKVSFKTILLHCIKLIQYLVESLQIREAIQSLNNLQIFMANSLSHNSPNKRWRIPQQLLKIGKTIKSQMKIKPITFTEDKGLILKQQLASICYVKLMIIQINMLYIVGKKDLVFETIKLAEQKIQLNKQNIMIITEGLLNCSIHHQHYQYFLKYLLQINKNWLNLEKQLISILIRLRQAGKTLKINNLPFLFYIFAHNKQQKESMIKLFNHVFEGFLSINHKQIVQIIIQLCKNDSQQTRIKPFMHRILHHFSLNVIHKNQSTQLVEKCIYGEIYRKNIQFTNKLLNFSYQKWIVYNANLSQLFTKELNGYLIKGQIDIKPQDFKRKVAKKYHVKSTYKCQIKSIVQYNYYLDRLVSKIKAIDIVKQGLNQQLSFIIKGLINFSKSQMKPVYYLSLCLFLQKSGVNSKQFAKQVVDWENNQEITIQNIFDFYLRCPQLKNELFFIKNFRHLILLPNFPHYIHLLPYVIDRPSLQLREVISTHKLADSSAQRCLLALKQKIRRQSQKAPVNKGIIFAYKNTIKLPQEVIHELFANTIFSSANYWSLEQGRVINGPGTEIINRIIRQSTFKKSQIKEQTSVKTSGNKEQISVKPKWLQPKKKDSK